MGRIAMKRRAQVFRPYFDFPKIIILVILSIVLGASEC